MTVKNNGPESKNGFMQRWSERKIESQTAIERNLEKESLPSDFSAKENFKESEPSNFKSDEDMTPLEQLTEESNYSDFLSPNVSDALRKQALRKLFHMPFLNVVDELDDYAEDYTKFAALGDIIPHEMKRMLEREKKKEQEQQELEEEQALRDRGELNTTELNNNESENEKLANDLATDFEADNPENKSINLKDKIDNEKLN
ncbi:MAG: DUF3306 domain-containing protein [Gammaproteobacteria bacterium]|nr:DUF3306 domain-containing protein [Gammaproteobacteria bacterium]